MSQTAVTESISYQNLTEEELTNLDSERRALKSNGAGENCFGQISLVDTHGVNQTGVNQLN